MTHASSARLVSRCETVECFHLDERSLSDGGGDRVGYGLAGCPESCD